MHNFQTQLRQVLKQFSPLEALDQELSQLCVSFRENLNQLATALEPAATLQDRLAHLSTAFEPAKTLRQEFSTLAQSFERSSANLSQ
jgi:DNA repair ATPase RecN